MEKIQVRAAWWLPLYLHGVVFVAAMFGMEPDWGKVHGMIVRSLRFRFVGNRRWHRL